MVNEVIENYFGAEKVKSVIPLARAGSDRNYFRIILFSGQSFIGCQNENIPENESFFYFSNVFKNHGIRVPEILYIHKDKKFYILSDLGDENLLSRVLKHGMGTAEEKLYKDALLQLIKMQVEAGKDIDFRKCFATQRFDRYAVRADLNYFKYYFVDLQDLVYNRPQLQLEFDQLSSTIEGITPGGFMYRDFQGRNIMIAEEKPYFIDYQGGMYGPLQYDVASLLWQARANLDGKTKESLFHFYKKELAKYQHFDDVVFDKNYHQLVLLRLIQVLGAYGFKGIIQKRQHFLRSIFPALQNVAEWLKQNRSVIEDYPELLRVLHYFSQEEFISRFQIPETEPSNKLKVSIQSFSYKNGIPEDSSGNGGGFVFDCRGILNPGRFDSYKKLTGRDPEVIDFLEKKTRISEFLTAVRQIVDISVEDYIARDFEHLMISFGCTGGQHRSVFCADSIGVYLREKYRVSVQVKHLVQDEKNWVN